MDISDLILENKITTLQRNVQSWAEQRGLWSDAGFRTYLEFTDDEPNEYGACVTVMYTEGGLNSMFNGYNYADYYEEFEKFIDTQEFYCENIGTCNYGFFAIDESLNEQYIKYFEWKWICDVIKPNYTSLYHEIFEYFNNNPDVLYRLSARKFEILISEIFRNQGYRTELGTGTDDGGVDVRLFKKDEIDDVVTLVQVKKYKPSLPIKLEAVASLSAIVNQENANRGLFVTTSRYLPGVKEFATRERSRLTLADSLDVSRWCAETKNIITRDKSLLFSDDHLFKIIKSSIRADNIGLVVVATTYYGMTLNYFCIVVKESAEIALLMQLPSNKENDDIPMNSTGSETPVLDERIILNRVKEKVFRAKKKTYENGQIGFWGDGKLFFPWDGKPRHYDYND